MEDCKYVCEYYGVNAFIGCGVIVNGRSGIIAEDRGHYIGVTFDEDEPGSISNCHPTWKVSYGERREIRKRKKMTRSQEKYQQYLKEDWWDSFPHFLGIAN